MSIPGVRFYLSLAGLVALLAVPGCRLFPPSFLTDGFRAEGLANDDDPTTGGPMTYFGVISGGRSSGSFMALDGSTMAWSDLLPRNVVENVVSINPSGIPLEEGGPVAGANARAEAQTRSYRLLRLKGKKRVRYDFSVAPVASDGGQVEVEISVKLIGGREHHVGPTPKDHYVFSWNGNNIKVVRNGRTSHLQGNPATKIYSEWLDLENLPDRLYVLQTDVKLVATGDRSATMKSKVMTSVK